MDWDNLGFGLIPADYMYTMKCSNDYFEKGRLSRYGKVELSPSSGVLNYGQASSTSFSIHYFLATSMIQLISLQPFSNWKFYMIRFHKLVSGELDPQLQPSL